ncbi:MAG: UTP--glucose-1-phosphate uridylyltransferase, partial [Terriglobales bacterium]
MLTTPPRLIRKAVFPAAGLGTRFLPATKAQPKEMLPLVDKPIIQYGVEEALDSGIDEIVIVTGRGKNSIEDHFDVSYELERTLEEKGKTDLLAVVREVSDMIHVAYVRQKEALGLGHAVLAAESLVAGEPFAVLLADDVIDAQVPVMRQMLDVYEATGASVVAVEKISGEAISSYGVVKPAAVQDSFDPDRFLGPVVRLADLIEKPRLEDAPSDLAVVGRYLLTPGI